MGHAAFCLIDQVETLVRRAQEDFPDAEIDVCVAWGRNGAVGGSTQIVSPKMGDPHGLVEDSKGCIDRLAALHYLGYRVSLLGPRDEAGESLYDLDPVYDWYRKQINDYAKTSEILVASLDLKLMSGAVTRFDKYHVKDLPSNCQALCLFVCDVVGLL